MIPAGSPEVTLPPWPVPLRPWSATPAGVDDLAVELLAVSARLDDTGGLARGGARLGSWTGRAGEAYRAALTPYAERADALSLALRAVGRRVEEHAVRLRALTGERDDLGARHALLVAELQRLADDVAGWHARGATDVLGGRLLQQRADDLGLRVADLDADHDGWWRRALAEDADTAAAFGRVADPDRAVALLAGTPDPADAALATLPASTAPPALVLAWWLGLTPEQRRAVLVAAPGAVGDRDGIPAADRDRANRLRLSRDLALLRRLVATGYATERERRTLANAEAVDGVLARHEGTVDARGRDLPVLLWTYDPGGFGHADGSVDGRVAIALGDPGTADDVSVNVPGVGTETSDVGAAVDRALALHDAATVADPTRDHASIAWLGYDAPAAVDGRRELEAAAGEGAADRGGDRLADSLDGLRAVGGGDLEIVPVGHSYGSVVVGSALEHHPVDVDRAAVVGSPGMGRGVHHVGDLHLGRGDLYVGRDPRDPVAGLGQNGAFGLGAVGHGQDPADDGFGATRFEANGAPGSDAHSSYYDVDRESLANLGAVVAGQDPTPAGPVVDPWWGPAHDPEVGADSDRVDTDGDGDDDGHRRRPTERAS